MVKQLEKIRIVNGSNKLIRIQYRPFTINYVRSGIYKIVIEQGDINYNNGTDKWGYTIWEGDTLDIDLRISDRDYNKLKMEQKLTTKEKRSLR